MTQNLQITDTGMPPFKPRLPWWGGDLQTLRNTVMRSETGLPVPSTRLYLPLHDGSGDRLAAGFSQPIKGGAQPLVVLIHGLTGCEDSPYMLASAAYHLKKGRPVLRLNLRGAGPARNTCKGHYHAGCGADVRDALSGLDAQLLSRGLLLVGYSLGGNVLLNLLAKHGDELPIIGAATVSAPIEPAVASRRLMAPRNIFYHRWLLRRMKDEAMAAGAAVSDKERAAILNASTIWDYDDKFIAPRHGFKDASDYYTRVAGAGMVPNIAVPTILIHAQNDPWIPAGAYGALHKRLPANVKICLPASGGHVGFHAANDHETWHDRTIDRFFKSL